MVTLPPHLSFSQVKSYSACPRRYKLERIDNVDRVEYFASTPGSAVHNWAEKLVKTGVGDLDTFADELWEACLESDPDQDKPLLISRGEDYDWWLENGRRMCSNIAAYVRRRGFVRMQAELEFAVDVPGISVPYRGKIDLTGFFEDGTAEIIDWKTGFYTEKTSDQIASYACVGKHFYGLDISGYRYYYPRSGSAGKLHTNVWSLEDLRDFLLPHHQGIRAQVWTPKPDFHCNYCQLKHLCPEGTARTSGVSRNGH